MRYSRCGAEDAAEEHRRATPLRSALRALGRGNTANALVYLRLAEEPDAHEALERGDTEDALGHIGNALARKLSKVERDRDGWRDSTESLERLLRTRVEKLEVDA